MGSSRHTFSRLSGLFGASSGSSESDPSALVSMSLWGVLMIPGCEERKARCCSWSLCLSAF